jgi:predicted dehydrogenase
MTNIVANNYFYRAARHSSQQEYVLEALKSGKHVLLNDPISTGMAEFIEQQALAKKYGKFIQFSTMFVYQFQGTSPDG